MGLNKKEPYGLTAAFETVVAVLCCQDAKFFSTIGHEVDPDCLRDPLCALVLKACRALALDNAGRGPGAPLLVVQRIRRWIQEGTATMDELTAASDMIDEALDAGLPDADAVRAELIPVLRRRMERNALDEAFRQYQKRGDLGEFAEKIQRLQTLGESTTDLGTVMGPASFNRIEELRQIERLPTGILELDDVLGGGMYRGTESVFVGNSGAGKSMALIQIDAHALKCGMNVAKVTLELPEAVILARIKSNLTGITIDRILAEPHTCGAAERLALLQASGNFGRLVVKSFSPQVTTIADITSWVSEVERDLGIPIDVLDVDYADKCIAPKGRDSDNLYTTGKVVFEGLRLWAEARRKWAVTASASGREKEKKNKQLDINDISDSMHKVRVADLVVTLNPDDDMLKWFIAKNRLGRSRVSIGPLPTDFALARIVPVDDAQPFGALPE